MALQQGNENAVPDVDLTDGKHFSCTLSAVLIGRVRQHGGPAAVARLLDEAGSQRSAGYLGDIGNWISYDEAVALWDAGARITHHPAFARAVGQDTAERFGGTPMATLLRSLGAPEKVYEEIAVAATKYSTVITGEPGPLEPGHATVVARPVPGFPRSRHHCEWTIGLLSAVPILFGQPLATVEHERCAAFGAEVCEYHVRWENTRRVRATGEVAQLRRQIAAMTERLTSMFHTASDLIGPAEIDDVLARIAQRAAIEVRAPRHMLAVRLTAGGPLHCHQDGFAPDEALAVAEEIIAVGDAGVPTGWLTVPVRSNRRDYGWLLAAYNGAASFFPQEAELLEVYARYAASALDSASALQQAQARHDQSSALLGLARALAVAGTSDEVAHRLADAVPSVVDCDHTAVFVWDGGGLVRHAYTDVPGARPLPDELARWSPQPGSLLEGLVADPSPEPIFLSTASESLHRDLLAELGFEATILVPLVAGHQLLGMLIVAVRDQADRLSPSPELLDRLSGIGAQASTALQNGRLVDLITYQARHDQLTGLANRAQFASELNAAVDRAQTTGELATLFYVDLDRFKPVNDNLGHGYGDLLLTAVAERLRHCTRATDVVARLGGDEFAVLVSATSAADIDRVGIRIGAAFDEPFLIGDHRLELDASIGRASYPGEAAGAEELLRKADEGMFGVKREHHRTRPNGQGAARGTALGPVHVVDAA
jgi:diguanylate cyclase (GGDEF)-like protein